MARNKRLEANTSSNLAILLKEQEKYVEARILSKQAIEIAHEIGWRRLEAIAIFNLAALDYISGYQPQSFLNLAEKALAIAQMIDDRWITGTILTGMATAIRQMGGELEEASYYANQAEEILYTTDQFDQLNLCLCEQGFLALAQNQSANAILTQLKQNCQSYTVLASSCLKERIELLELSQTAFEQGQPLYRGEYPGHFPPGLQEWLQHN
ncbi:hypothetical protein JXQ70_15695 [bacterium]|nr:hypothetical protein [bacterium]